MRSLHYYVVQVAYKAAQLLPAPVTHAPKKKKKLAATRGASWELWFINTFRATERDAAGSACKLQHPEAAGRRSFLAAKPRSALIRRLHVDSFADFSNKKRELRVSKSYIIDHT